MPIFLIINNMNYYSWMKKIHMVRMMIIIVCTWKTINGSLGKPKNLLPLKVQNAIREGKSGHVICHSNLWFNRITRLLGPPQQQFIPIMSMTT
jgi:hypothetical protein